MTHLNITNEILIVIVTYGEVVCVFHFQSQDLDAFVELLDFQLPFVLLDDEAQVSFVARDFQLSFVLDDELPPHPIFTSTASAASAAAAAA